MPPDPDELLQKHIIKNLNVCSRCFTPVMSKQEKGSGIAAGTPCSNECGAMSLSMESAPQPERELKHRADRLMTILESNNIDIDSDLFFRAVEDNASDEPPRKVFTIALEYGLGQRDEKELLPDQEQDQDIEEENDSTIPSYEDLPERLADGPITAGELETFESPPEIIDRLSRFSVPMNTSDIYYLDNPQDFAADYDLDETPAHSPYDVIYAALGVNWSVLEDASAGTIRKWMNEMEDEFSQHILLVAVAVQPYSPIDPHDPSFRSTSFWPLVKRQKAQPILGFMQSEQKSPLTTKEIAEGVEESEAFVQRVLKILSENEKVERQSRTFSKEDDRWLYIED